MLSIERVKEIVNDPNLSESELEAIRDESRMLVELIFEQWQKDKIRNSKP